MNLDPKDYVIPEVWKIVDTKMDEENKMILREMLEPLLDKFVLNDPKSYKRLRVPWDVLKSCLLYTSPSPRDS